MDVMRAIIDVILGGIVAVALLGFIGWGIVMMLTALDDTEGQDYSR
jgi:hypothetical protein